MGFLNFIHFTVGQICNVSNSIYSMERIVKDDANLESDKLQNIELEEKKNKKIDSKH